MWPWTSFSRSSKARTNSGSYPGRPPTSAITQRQLIIDGACRSLGRTADWIAASAHANNRTRKPLTGLIPTSGVVRPSRIPITQVRENQQDLGRTTLDFVQFQQATLRNGLIHQKLLTGSGLA